MAVTRRRVILDAVPGEAHEQLVGGGPLGAGAVGGDVLVVLLFTGKQVGAEAVAVVFGEGAADGEGVAQRDGGRDQGIALIIAADRAAPHELELVAETLGHVLDRAADGVAAVERALRTAQDLDATHIEDVEHGALRASDIDVVDIEAHARLEAPERILLADAADEGDQGRVGAAGDLDGRVRGLLLQRRDVGGAGALKLLGRQSRNGDGHVLQLLVAATGGDDDVVQRGLVVLRHGVLCHHHRGGGAPRGPGQQHALHDSVHAKPFSCVVSSRDAFIQRSMIFAETDPL